MDMGNIDDMLSGMEGEEGEALEGASDEVSAAADNELVKLVNKVIVDAFNQGASDIHIEPYEARSAVRFRLDGTVHNVAEPHRGLHAAMLSRIKIMANLDIAEKRLPQDGRILLRLAGRPIDVRVSTLPAGHGERVVLRLLLSHLPLSCLRLP